LIEVNLLPGGKKKSAGRRKLSFAMPRLGGRLPQVDRWSAGVGIVILAVLAFCGWLFLSIQGDAEELEVQTEVAVRDSIRLADILDESSLLQARADSIAQRVAAIQEIDQNRYVWPHLMDEVARALPEYAWLISLTQIADGGDLAFQIQGQAGTYFALTTFMQGLEASPFIRNVQLINSQQVSVSTDDSRNERLLYEFTLEAEEQRPPSEVIETVPLFGPSVSAPASQGDR
jgi:Tfp pilus assembly protein PilN